MSSSCSNDLLIVRAATPASANVRLVNGNKPCEGRVEVLYSGQWGTVCDDGWDLIDANVVCRELNCGIATGCPHSAAFGQGSGNIWLDDVRCTGRETSLHNCASAGWGINNCAHTEDAGVICRVLTLQAVLRVSIMVNADIDPNSPIIQQLVLDEVSAEKLKYFPFSVSHLIITATCHF
ncbi:hypothetical protein ACEWY4_001459 [Coilia grayii]|uniref:SRCR domain-containing protein n=1 Tax=Coilia grayii TaxID=363190 RepID=A0ABD1KTF1_9TELE